MTLTTKPRPAYTPEEDAALDALLDACPYCGSTDTLELGSERNGREQTITVCATCGMD